MRRLFPHRRRAKRERRRDGASGGRDEDLRRDEPQERAPRFSAVREVDPSKTALLEIDRRSPDELADRPAHPRFVADEEERLRPPVLAQHPLEPDAIEGKTEPLEIGRA